MLESIHGEASWTLAHDRVKLAVSCRAGHLAPVEFQLGLRTVSPYALAPWSAAEADPSLPDLLKVLRGDFFCFPFGPQAEAPPHGASANHNWSLVDRGKDRLHLALDDPDSGGRVEKIVSLREGETAVYVEHRITGVEGRYSYGNHPILDFSQLSDGEGRVSLSPFRWASVYPGRFSDPSRLEAGALMPGGRFVDLREVPLAGGGTTDLTRYPAREGFDDLVMMVSSPNAEKQLFAWSAAVMDGYLWFSLKNPADFPATLLWISNGGRHAPPWNGRHLARMGIEEVCSHFSDGVDVSRGDLLAEESIPTTRWFDRDQEVQLRIVQGVAATAEKFGVVASIVPDGPQRVIISDDAGLTLRVPVDWRYVF
ncbi:hypothetical protein [Haloferula sargassicola]|uniref:Uncharacterized protein n=1 Tax=Haloferula sargassicola TaxID=490096 RepID=A0ABP9UR88_9BACT